MRMAPSSGGGSDGFVVTGGQRFAVRLESLEASAAALRSSAEALGRARDGIYLSRLSVSPGACSTSGLGFEFGDQAWRLEERTRRAREESEGCATAVVRAAQAYCEEETAKAQALDGLQNVLLKADVMSGLLDVLGLGALGAASQPGVRSSTLAKFLKEVARDRMAGSATDVGRATRTALTPGAGDASRFSYALESLRQAQGHEPLDDGSFVPPSSIMVERVPRADGSFAVVVTVPGTQTWASDSEDGNLFDTEGILDGLAYRDSQTRTLIKQALEDQKIGSDDVVLFNCYSQGGIHVLGLLEDPAFVERYRVGAVTAVGSPVSAFDVPRGVPILSLTNADDIVPTASGRAAVPTESVLNVRTPSRSGPAAAGLFPQTVVAQAHDLGNYAGDAQELDRSDDSAVLAHKAAVGAALGAAAGTAPAAGTVAGAGAPGSTDSRRERFAYTASDPKTKG